MSPREKELEKENHDLKEKLENYIPRRRVRRVFKQLKKILEQDVENNNKKYVQTLKEFIYVIEKEGCAVAGQDIKESIEHLLSNYELNTKED